MHQGPVHTVGTGRLGIVAHHRLSWGSGGVSQKHKAVPTETFTALVRRPATCSSWPLSDLFEVHGRSSVPAPSSLAHVPFCSRPLPSSCPSPFCLMFSVHCFCSGLFCALLLSPLNLFSFSVQMCRHAKAGGEGHVT